MLLFGNTGKRSGFAYITVPEHVVKELLKLHGIEFNGRKLVTEQKHQKHRLRKLLEKTSKLLYKTSHRQQILKWKLLKQFHLFNERPVHIEIQYSQKS